MGHVFNKEGYGLSEQRKQDVLSMSVPRSLKELRSFLGMLNFFRDFIPNLSLLLKPLTDMTQVKPSTPKSLRLHWSPEALQAFEDAKQAVVKSLNLRFLQSNGTIYLYTDASTVGIGAILTQVVDSKMYPIMCLSKKFTPAESRWATIEQELFAIVYAMHHLTSLLLGREFTIFSDHRNLAYLQTSSNDKVVRWRLSMQIFRYNIQHIAGVDNVVADVLSRLTTNYVFLLGAVATDEVTQENPSPPSTTLTPSLHPRLVHIANRSPTISDIVSTLSSKVVTLADGTVWNAYSLLSSLHNAIVGHHGESQLEAVVRLNKLQWDNYTIDIKMFLQTCIICCKLKYRPPILNLNKPKTLYSSYPFKSVAVDYIGPLPEDKFGYKYILTFVCHFSKYNTFLVPTREITAEAYAHALVQFISIFGRMESI